MNAAPLVAYERLASRFRRIATINECGSMLSWDAAAVMPTGGGAVRGDQLAVLAGLAHAEMIAPDSAADLAEAEQGLPADPWRDANLRLMRHSHTRATALPRDLVEASAKACSTCEKVWRDARQNSDFASVLPYLQEVVALVRESATALSSVLGLSPYDSLVDGFQPGIRAADVMPVFAEYEAFLRRVLPEAEARQAAQPAPVRPQGPVPDRHAGSLVPLDLGSGSDSTSNMPGLDKSAHPFSGGSRTDVRITTRYTEADFTQAVLAVVHETGHALYERGLPDAWARQPVGEAAGMAAHESQSLIIEMQACRSDAFLGWLSGELQSGIWR